MEIMHSDYREGYWCVSRLGEFVSKWKDDVREKCVEWLRRDQDLGLVVGEGSIIKFISYVKIRQRERIGGGKYLISKDRIWEDVFYGPEGNFVVKLWDREICRYREDVGYFRVKE